MSLPTKRLTTLTAAQLSAMPAVRDEWIAHGLSTQPADRKQAIAGVRMAYKAAGLPPPRVAMWLHSPLGGVIGAGLLANVRDNVRDNVGANVWDNVWANVWANVRDNVWDNVWANVWDNVWANVRDNVRDNVGANVRANVRANVGANVRANVGANVRDNVGDNVWDNVRDQLNKVAYGQHDAWLSFYDYFRQHTDIDVSPLDGMTLVAKSAGWWWPFAGAVIITDRPAQLHRDAQGRLHRGDGPAIAYRDGFGVHAWHGTRVPADIASWDVERILNERNAEIRRCAIEVIGWDSFVAAAHLRLVATCEDPGNDGLPLQLYDLPPALAGMYDQPARVLLCVNGSVERDGTRRRYGLVVPAHHDDPVAAAAELYDMPVAAYRQLEVRR